MTNFVRVARTEDIPLGECRDFEIHDVELMIAHTSDGFFAIADECTHDGASLDTGELEGHEVVCPRHGARFDVRDGSVTRPPAIVPVETFHVKIVKDDILVDLG